MDQISKNTSSTVWIHSTVDGATVLRRRSARFFWLVLYVVIPPGRMLHIRDIQLRTCSRNQARKLTALPFPQIRAPASPLITTAATLHYSRLHTVVGGAAPLPIYRLQLAIVNTKNSRTQRGGQNTSVVTDVRSVIEVQRQRQ